MPASERIVRGILVIVIVVFAGILLVRHGSYGWTLFVVLPIITGGIGSWVRLNFPQTDEKRPVGRRRSAPWIGQLTNFEAVGLSRRLRPTRSYPVGLVGLATG